MWVDGGKPWSACFRAAARESPSWDENVRHLADAKVVRSTKGAAFTPGERTAMAVMPGGAEALRVPVEDPASAIRRARPGHRSHRARKTAARKVREAAEAGWKAPPWPPPAAQEGAAVNVYLPRAREGLGKRRRDEGDQELCFSFNNKVGRCAAGAAGGDCPAGRVHSCTGCGDAWHAFADGWC
jgi:hypothetical protein